MVVPDLHLAALIVEDHLAHPAEVMIRAQAEVAVARDLLQVVHQEVVVVVQEEVANK
jgi:hypothetical protein